MPNFAIGNDLNRVEQLLVVGVLRKPRLWIPTQTDYPEHDAWLQKVESELETGKKRSWLVKVNDQPAGALVYQRHSSLPNTLEIRNISVEPEASGQLVGSFILHNTEKQARVDFPEVTEVMVDTKISNTEMLGFLMRHGYTLQEVTDLYSQGASLDAVLTKQLAPTA